REYLACCSVEAVSSNGRFSEPMRLTWSLTKDPYDSTLWTIVREIADEERVCCLSTEQLAALAKMKNEYAIHNNIHFLRQFGYLLQYNQIINKDWSPDCYFIYVSEKEAAFVKEQIRQTEKGKSKTEVFMILPAGDYLCFGFQLRHMEELNTNLIQEYFANMEVPPYVIANEHEDNLITYKYCPYELQFYLKK
ncbi:MAG: hypothetical protein HGA25_03675, partial [Clostridiales bacterium]|nr:hypothetical protein [Clostridiales bacterium]